ncbi:Isoleucine--tRNA ligase, mitochondrial [Toxocara canis]|uniref:isoleucine--tRNA ligase n=1 Tax=Toxocara canis TaxID=6265 RepID=A0A0B2VZW2_TOXCA|nr:Isoleucine--tRNA ligase, mitochondrial [Toxocara canis]
MSALQVRHAARMIAERSIDKQMNSFKRWGVAAEWDRPYRTMDADYVCRQLRLFAELLDRKLVYRAFKPVYWSPSSLSALAESELDYNNEHVSTAVFYRFPIINGQHIINQCKAVARPNKLFALVWTTTPWTLPLNDAIAFKRDASYAIITISQQKGQPVRNLYLISQDLVTDFEKRTGLQTELAATIGGQVLTGLMYRSCMYSDIAQPLLAASHVTTTIGTGLVHTCYAHGFDDYKLAVRRGDKICCYVDEKGTYSRQLGYELEGKSVLGEGQEAALQLLKKDVIHTHPYTHAYPYDWRTKRPVIIRTSEQWFIDVSCISAQAVELIRGGDISIGSSLSDKREALLSQLRDRPAWCISRQRAWGVPIPAFMKDDGDVVISKELVEAIANRVQVEGTNVWWERDAQNLFPTELRTKYGIEESTALWKGGDVMDVWLDSGVAWGCARDEERCGEAADLVLEGVDQFRGWFQSLLLTSFALQGKAPYKRVLVHGFAVDEHKKKMSKSLGNVIDPDVITDGSLKSDALGADGLRLWVALYGSEGNDARLGANVIADVQKKEAQIRNSFRFLLGSLHGFSKVEQLSGNSPYLDQYVLHETSKFVNRCLKNYDQYKFRVFTNDFIQFLQRPLSSDFISALKDRLYCGSNVERLHAQTTFYHVGLKLAAVICPVLPHLAAEFLQKHPCIVDPDEIFKNTQKLLSREYEMDADAYAAVKWVFELRSKLFELIGDGTLDKTGVHIECGLEEAKRLSLLQKEDRSFHSELVEILGVSMAILVRRCEQHHLVVKLIASEGDYCDRCRKKNRPHSDTHCFRCTNALKEYAISAS